MNSAPSFTDLSTAYDTAIEYLNDNYAYFLTNVLNIGSPSWDSGIPTAAVTMDKDASDVEAKNKFGFLFNPSFAATLTPEQFAFVLSHETLHIILYHLTLSHNFDNKEIFNVAADCVINDILVNAGLEAPNNVCIGESIVGFNCANSTVTEVYNIIENSPDIQNSLGLDSDEPQYFVIDSHDWMHDPENLNKFFNAVASSGITPENLPDDLEEIMSETINEYKKTQMAGKGVGKEEFMKEQQVSLKWVELLERVDPDMFMLPGAGPKPLTSFRKARRKLASMYTYSDAILPSMETPEHGTMSSRSDRKPAIVLALDTSGSIGQDTANKFVNLAKSIPQDKVKVFACTFTTRYKPLDINKPSWRIGGTDFSAIEAYIQEVVIPENNDRYPKAVVVVTDGYAGFYNKSIPSKDDVNGWFWLLLNNRQKNEAISNLASYGFDSESFDVLDGFTHNAAR